jgi:zinc protease
MAQEHDVAFLVSPEAQVEIPALPSGVRLVELANGLAAIIREDHSAPVVSAQAWCKAGSIREGRWLGAGLSHLLEHMLFKGTTTRGASRIDQEAHDAGGYVNAYTSFDRTVYWINVPNTGARVALDILCDIMQHATLPADELAKEMEVIRREMDMNQDDPARRASRRLFETAYTQSPYRYTVIGYPDIFGQLQRADIVAYYREQYAPNNQFLVIVGDFNAEAVLAQATAAYSQAKPRPLSPMALPEEPRQTGPREVIEEAPVELGHAHFGWHIPELRHPDVPVLDVIATLLGGGRSSRLFQAVREKLGLVHQVDAWTYSPGNPGLFGVSFVTDAGKFDEARAALLDQVERIKQQAVASDELRKAVKQFVSATLAARKTMQGQAQDLGANWLAANDLNFSARYLATVKRLTPADVQRVASQYLTAENRTLYALLPVAAAPKPAVTVEASREHRIQKITLCNGLRLLLKEDHRLPFVEFRAVFKGGVLAETPHDSGLTQLTAKMLLKGTTTRSAEQIVTEIESVGGSIDTYGGNNSFGVNLELLSTDLAAGLALFADVLLDPSFPAPELDRERQVQLAAIKDQRDQLLQSCGRLMRRTLFGDLGYGLDLLGSESSVTQVQAADLRTYHQRLVVPANGVLAIYGDIRPDEVKAAVERAFAAWKPGEAFAPGPALVPPNGPRRVDESRDKEQAVLIVGYPGTTVHHPDRYRLEILQEACSGLGARLFLRIREKLGLAYYVGAQNFLGLVPGYFAFYVGTAPDKLEQVEREIFKETELLRAEGLTPEELHRAKAKIIGQKKIARQDLGNLAMTTALDELYGLGFDNIDREDAQYEAVTLEEVKAVPQAYLDPAKSVVAVLAPKPCPAARRLPSGAGGDACPALNSRRTP